MNSIDTVSELLKPTDYKVTKWYNTKTKNFMFGIMAKVNGEWHNCRIAFKTKDNFFDNIKDANLKKKELLSTLSFKTNQS